ncbi:M14 family metallopeptidase [Capnocytophaga canimorsus]|uniref:M14 family metallopeptidase n=1 Tax=Capnocytophaga canimorsus TaxID=28188 RepID=UPI0037D26068
MIKKYCYTYLFLLLMISCENPFFPKKPSFVTHFENSNGTESPTYQEVIDFYKALSKEYSTISLKTMQKTDSGHPLHIVTYSPEADFNFAKLRENKTIILINNAIHAGETDGVDATMLLLRNLAQEQFSVPENVVIVAIPMYNIGGALQRNGFTRVNQNGPKEYGFRGNAKNLDLNRDFIKSDSENALSFAQIFHLIQPDIFIDNHTTNGADYQHILTYGTTNREKLGTFLGNYLSDSLIPRLSDTLQKREQTLQKDSIVPTVYQLIPYVNVWNKPPDNEGYAKMLDTPRYSTGYAGLWNTMSILIETHMLKPYKQRVEANYEMMKNLIDIANAEHQKIKNIRSKQLEENLNRERFTVRWKLDSTQVNQIVFHGYKADTLTSEITGLPRLKYDQTQPFKKFIPYYDRYLSEEEVNIPLAYVVPKAWQKVIERLKANKVIMKEVEKDTLMLVDYYRIASFETVSQPYEGHYLHFNTKVTKHQANLPIDKGDWIIETQQNAQNYLLETLEPQAPDSFFNWNFFDTILQQKEHFSSYLFEEIALEFLNQNPQIKDSFQLKKQTDKTFAQNAYQQLNWIYQQTPHYEKNHLRYPIYRILKKQVQTTKIN